jgi:DNA-binding response OmpR family regulator
MAEILVNKVEDLKILIVDDNPKNLQIIGSYLVLEGYSVEFATDGETAIDWIESVQFDLILLDINMPVMDGYDVCRIIKKNPRHNKIPVIFITAKTDTDSIIKGFETGAVDYITKPFNHRELLARVKSQIEIKRGRDQITQNLADIESRNKLISESIDYAQKIQSSVFKLI